MAKITRLGIVQRVLSAMESENVSSCIETTEAEQVAAMLDTVYREIVTEYPWSHLIEMATLELTSLPHTLKLPVEVLGINWLRYKGKELIYITPTEMVYKLSTRNTDETFVDSTGVYNDRDPVYWTSYDDTEIILDAYDSQLIASLSEAMVIASPPELVADADVPNLPERFFPVLIDGVTAQAYFILKGDNVLGGFFFKKYRIGKIKMKRWAQRVNKERSTYSEVSYARTRTS